MDSPDPVTYGLIARRAWPLILANCSVPLLGLADTAVLGNLGTLFDLGAIALGAIVFSFVYWGFGFLRMGTTGFIAQAQGRNDSAEIRAVMFRSLALALVSGILLTLLQIPVVEFACWLLGGSDQVEDLVRSYFLIRIWGAPATLGTFVLVGVLVGLGESKWLLLVQLFLNLLNIFLDLYLAGYLRLGVQGIAMGTLLAEWAAFGFALVLVVRLLMRCRQDDEGFLVLSRLLDRQRILTILSANTDIMIRTITLVLSFAWFTNQSARFGDVVLAANHILLQLVSFSAFFLDGFAFVGESLVGRAVGAGDKLLFDRAVQRTSVMAFATAVILALLLLAGGQQAIEWLTDLGQVQAMAMGLLPLASIYIMVSFAAFQLDGIFIGATFTVQLRNASLLAAAIFLFARWVMTSLFGLTGLWVSFILFVCARAMTLLMYFPDLRKSFV